MKRLFLLGTVPISATFVLFACSDDAGTTRFDAPSSDAAVESTANLPETSPPSNDAGPDVVDAEAPFDGADEPIVCNAQPCVKQLVGGSTHLCALLEDKTVRCWGSGYIAFGTYDGGTYTDKPTPIDMGLTDVVELAAGNGTTCARFTDGSIGCWGSNQGNELGYEPPSSDYAPHDFAKIARDGVPLTGFRHIAIGSFGLVFAVKEDGTVWSWGDNGSLGLARSAEQGPYMAPGPATDLAGIPVRTAGGLSSSNFVSMAYAITADGRLYQWGNAAQLVKYPGIVPMPMAGLQNVSSVSMIASNACAVANGKLMCWGSDGRLACSGAKDPILEPLEIRTHGEGRAQQVSVSYANVCVRKTDGAIECCGSDGYGQLATGVPNTATPNAGDPLQPLLSEAKGFSGHAVHVWVGARAVCALMQGGTVQCVGGNDQGVLGQGTIDQERHTTAVVVKFD